MPDTFIIVPLKLGKEETAYLLQKNQEFGEKLEKNGFLDSIWINNLKEGMRKILENQPSFSKIIIGNSNSDQILHITHSNPAILNLPWRLAIKDLMNVYLTKGIRLKEEGLSELIPYPPPLKILIMISSPEDMGFDSRLSYEEEEELIIDSFKILFDIDQIQIDFTDDGSLESLHEKIKSNHYHVVHYSGHGFFKNDMGYLVLEDKITMNKKLVSAVDFASIFEKSDNLPSLLVLNSCQTSTGKRELGMQSIAGELLQRKVPAVIAMNVSIIDHFATFFAGSLYKNLAEKKPLNQAFKTAIDKTYQYEINKIQHSQPSQWMIPQLFLSKKIKQLVDWSKPETRIENTLSSNKINDVKATIQRIEDNYGFVGRRQDRKKIFPILIERTSILLTGQGGIGKTTMANYLLRRIAINNTHTAIFGYNQTNASLSNILSDLKSFLINKQSTNILTEAERASGNNQFAQIKWILKKIRKEYYIIFLFDNLETFQSSPGEVFNKEHQDIESLIKFLCNVDILLILTCRYPLKNFPEIHNFNLNQVSKNDFLKKSLQLSLKVLPKKIQQIGLSYIVEKRLTFREVVDWLYETLGGNYRALEMFDQLFIKNIEGLDQVLINLANFKEYFKEEEIEVRQHMSKDLFFSELLNLFNVNEKIVLQLISFFKVPVLSDAIKLQNENLKLTEILPKLASFNLLEKHIYINQPEVVYYYVTPLVRELTKEALPIQVKFNPDLGGQYLWDERHTRNHWDIKEFIEAFSFFIESSNTQKATEVGDFLCDLFYKYYQLEKALYYGVMVYELNQLDTSYRTMSLLTSCYSTLGEAEKSIEFNKILRTKAKKENKIHYEIESLKGIGSNYFKLGRFEDASIYFNLARQLCGKTKNYYSENELLFELSKIEFYSGNYGKALEYLNSIVAYCRTEKEKPLELGVKNAYVYLEIKALNSIASVFKIHGKPQIALEYFLQTLTLAEEIGEKKSIGSILSNIGDIYTALSDNDNALEYMEKSLKLSNEIGDKLGEATNLHNLGQLYQTMGDYTNALRYLNLALKINREINDYQGESITLMSLSFVFFHRKDNDKSLEYLLEALPIQRRIGDKREECKTLNNIGEVYKAKRNLDLAIKFLEQSLDISRSIGLIASECNTMTNISYIYLEKGDSLTASIYLNKSLDIAKKINDKVLESQALHGLAIIALDEHEHEKYLSYMTECYQIALNTGNAYNIYRFGTDLGIFLCKIGVIDRGIEILKKAFVISKNNGLPNTKYLATNIQYFQNKKNG